MEFSTIAKIGVFVWTFLLVCLLIFWKDSPEVQPGERFEADETGQVPIDFDTHENTDVPKTTDTQQARDRANFQSSLSVRLESLEYLPNDRLPHGRVLAYLNSTKYWLDERGRLLNNERRHTDVPIITFEGVSINTKKYAIDDEAVLSVLKFLDIAENEYAPLYYRISQIDIDDKLGPIVYLEQNALPIIVGQGHEKRKVAYVATILTYLDNNHDFGDIQYLDARLEGQIVAKMNNS